MKIYTKTGDAGETSLFDGSRVGKTDPIINLLGDLDELNAHFGLLYSIIDQQLQQMILDIISNLFKLGAALAGAPKFDQLDLSLSTITLENMIDELTVKLPPLTNFIYPLGSVAVAEIHITRAICRRVERQLVEVHLMSMIDSSNLAYINRLSDFLFTLARFNAHQTNTPEIVVNFEG